MKILITGGTNGMGKGVAKVLAGIDNQTHEVIILCRSEDLGKTVISEIEASTGNNKVSYILCDLTRLSNVRSALIEIQCKHEFLDCIFINAGLGYAPKRVVTEDGMDSHFQVNYLSQFMLTLNLLNLLEKSEKGGRIIFNVTQFGKIFWDDMQMENNWSYEKGIFQAMFAKRMFLVTLNNLYNEMKDRKISFIGFQIPKTVWSNQINIIPLPMKTMATIMKLFGTFISIEKCGCIMAPLFTESFEESYAKSGKLITWKSNRFLEISEEKAVLDLDMQYRLWKCSLELCNYEETNQIAEKLYNYSR
jgi:hypothetical protein